MVAPTENLSDQHIAEVSADKVEDGAKTILHGCGHKFCNAPEHLSIGSKRLNDEQSACHRALQSASSLEEYNIIRRYACRHDPKCWTVIYGGQYSDVVSWSSS